MDRHPPAASLAFPRPPRDYTWMTLFGRLLIPVLWMALLVSSIHVGPATPADYQPLSPLKILLGSLSFFWPFLAWTVLNWVVGSLLLIKPLALRTLNQRTGTPASELGISYLWVGHLLLQFFCCLEALFLWSWLMHQPLVLEVGIVLSGGLLVLEAAGVRWITRRLLRRSSQR